MYIDDSELPTHSLLTSQGWDWVTNCSKAEGEQVLNAMREQDGHARWRLGEPVSERVSTVQLIGMGMVGVYRKGGGRPVKCTLDTPSLPFFSVPNKPADMPKKQAPHDRPIQPMFTRSCIGAA